jgi:sulfur carrier protein
MGETQRRVVIRVNGDARSAGSGVTLAQVVRETTALSSGVAAAVNGEVVPRRDWDTRVLREGDQVEVVTAVQGG